MNTVSIIEFENDIDIAQARRYDGIIFFFEIEKVNIVLIMQQKYTSEHFGPMLTIAAFCCIAA